MPVLATKEISNTAIRTSYGCIPTVAQRDNQLLPLGAIALLEVRVVAAILQHSRSSTRLRVDQTFTAKNVSRRTVLIVWSAKLPPQPARSVAWKVAFHIDEPVAMGVAVGFDFDAPRPFGIGSKERQFRKIALAFPFQLDRPPHPQLRVSM